MANFTKGEWRYSEYTGLVTTNAHEQNEFPIVHVFLADRFSYKDIQVADELNANARLIAAAPEMYELLKSMSYRTSGMEQHEVLKIRALLARIEGKEVDNA